MSATRIPFPASGELSADVRAQLARRPPVYLYRMVAHAPTLLEPFMSLVLANFNTLSLSPRLREAIILRVGAHRRSHYEIHHHRVKAREAGLDEACIDSLLALRPPAQLTQPGLADAVALADALTAGQPVSDDLLQRLVQAHAHRGYAEMALLVGFYGMVATFIEATGIEPEPAGELMNTPLPS
jgi:alkylhydroperoxidase family enzyme